MRPTPEATIGPFYPGAFVAAMPQNLWLVSPLVAHHPHGQPIVCALRFLDANGHAVPSVVVEIWQANAYGRYRHRLDQSSRPLDPQFDGFARLRTGDEGSSRLHTIKPGPHPVREGSEVMRAPHLRLTIFASGIDRLVTQVFFEGEPLNEQRATQRAGLYFSHRAGIRSQSRDRRTRNARIWRPHIPLRHRAARAVPDPAGL